MSLLTGRIISEVHSQHPDLAPNVIASALAVLCGAFVFVLGILRLGYVFPFKKISSRLLSFPDFHYLATLSQVHRGLHSATR